jgi:Zn-dependent protease
LAVAYWGSRIVPGATATWIVVIGMAQYGIMINLVLILFNLVPIPPLDGSHVMYHLLPPQLGMRYRELGRFGMLLVFAFLFLGGLNFLMTPLQYLYGLAISVANFLV